MSDILQFLDHYSAELTIIVLATVVAIELAFSFHGAFRHWPENHRRRKVLMRIFCGVLYFGLIWQFLRQIH